MMNLDEMSIEDLRNFVALANDKSFAAEVFPDKPPQFVRALNLMQRYSQERIELLEQTAKGRMERAKRAREKCNAIFRSLPDYAKWM